MSNSFNIGSLAISVLILTVIALFQEVYSVSSLWASSPCPVKTVKPPSNLATSLDVDSFSKRKSANSLPPVSSVQQKKIRHSQGEQLANQLRSVAEAIENFKISNNDVLNVSTNHVQLCRSKQCYQTANIFRNSLDETNDPCKNFYKFVCGKYSKLYHVPPGSWAKGWTFDLEEKVKQEVLEFLRKPVNPRDPEAVNKARNYYRMCLNTDEIDRLGYQPLIMTLNSLGIPLLPLFPKDTDINISYILAKLQRQPFVPFLFDVEVYGDETNQLINSVYITKAGPSIRSLGFKNLVGDPLFLLNSKLKEEAKTENISKLEEILKKCVPTFFKYVQTIINLLKPYAMMESNINLEDPQFLEDIRSLFNFLIKREQILSDDEKEQFKIMTLKELQNKTMKKSNGKISFNWLEYLNTVFENVLGRSYRFDEDDEIIISNWDTLKKSLQLISETHPRVIAMAIWFDHVNSFEMATSKELRKLRDKFTAAMFNGNIEPREVLCQQKIMPVVGNALSSKWAKDPMVIFKKYKLEYLVDVLKEVFKYTLNKAEWIDPFAKQIALEKIKTMKRFVAIPGWVMDHKVLDDAFADLNIDLNNYVWITMDYKIKMKLSQLSNLFYPNDENSKGFRMQPHVVNACYSTGDNSLTIPYGIINLPYYGFGVDSLDMGSIGVVLAHEITHGYDDNGKNYNHDGNNSIWMMKSSIKHFREGAKCFIQFYNGLRIEELGVNVNGELTLNENIADNGAISIAYKAFSIIKNRRPNYAIPGFERYSSEQLFTMGYALTQCGVYSKKYLEIHSTKVHTTPEQRINGMMMNFSEFAKIWKCKENSPMNPSKKCKIW